jgi:hypothetical protein
LGKSEFRNKRNVRKQYNMISPKLNSIVTNTSEREEEEISNNSKDTMRITNKIKRT